MGGYQGKIKIAQIVRCFYWPIVCHNTYKNIQFDVIHIFTTCTLILRLISSFRDFHPLLLSDLVYNTVDFFWCCSIITLKHARFRFLFHFNFDRYSAHKLAIYTQVSVLIENRG